MRYYQNKRNNIGANKLSIALTGVRLTKRSFLVIMILFVSFFSWYFSFSLSVLQRITGLSTTFSVISASFNFVIALTLLLGSFFINRFNKVHVIYGYSITTSIACFLLLAISAAVLRLIIVFAAGIFFSIGQLAFFAYFWSLTTSVERGRVAGFAGFFALPFAYILGLIADISSFSGTIVLGIILSLSALAIRLLDPEKKAIPKTVKGENGYHAEKRTILLYAIPWVLFSLINATLARNISFNLSQIPSSFLIFLLVLQMTASGFGALSGGIIGDFFGRRLSLSLSLTLYGISTAIGGLLQSYDALCFVYAANGFSWGIIWTMYISVIWGDLADKESCAKRYSLGLTIFYLATSVGLFLTPQITSVPLIASALVGCFLIFLSNLPLVLAPELLSSDFREKIKLKLHIKAVKKIRRSQNQG